MKNGYLAAAASYAIWGLLPIFWKLLNHLSPFYILAARIFFSFLFCLLLVQCVKAWPKLKAKLTQTRTVVFTLIASLLITANWGIYIWAVNNNHILDSSMGYYLNPLLVILIGTVVFKERLTLWEGIALLIASIGVCIMVLQYGRVPWIALGLAATFALYGAVKKFVRLDSLLSLTMETAFVALPALGWLCWSEQTTVIPHDLTTVVLLCGSGIVTAIPLLLYGYAVKTIPFATVGFFQFISPTISMLLGLFVYGEQFSHGELVTFGFIWAALIFYIISKMMEMAKK